MLFEVLYLDFLNVAMKQLFKKKNPWLGRSKFFFTELCVVYFFYVE